MSAQAEVELARALADEAAMDRTVESAPGYGRYRGARVPTDDEIAEVRASLWGRLDLDRG